MSDDYKKIHEDSVARLVRCARINALSWIWSSVVLAILLVWISSLEIHMGLERIICWIMGFGTGWVLGLLGQVLVLKFGRGR